jgi:hypothetical protein
MSAQNIKTAVELGIISLQQATELLKQEAKTHEKEQIKQKSS